MITQLKAEVRKLLTVRSTYIMMILALVFISLFAYFGTSGLTYEEAVCESTGEVLYSMNHTDPRLEGTSPEEVCGGEVSYVTKTDNNLPDDKLLYSLQEAVPIMATFASVVVILLMAHEFRYSTINYTLTISNSRSKVLLSKMLVSIVFVIAATLLAVGVSFAVTQAAINIKGLSLHTQDYNWLYILARHLGYVLGYALFSLGIITLVRNLTAGIAAIFVLPTLDSIAGFLLAARNIEPTKILPFTALDRFGNVATDLSTSGTTADFMVKTSSGAASVAVAGLVVAAYLLVVWLVTWYLFLHRDAN